VAEESASPVTDQNRSKPIGGVLTSPRRATRGVPREIGGRALLGSDLLEFRRTAQPACRRGDRTRIPSRHGWPAAGRPGCGRYEARGTANARSPDRALNWYNSRSGLALRSARSPVISLGTSLGRVVRRKVSDGSQAATTGEAQAHLLVARRECRARGSGGDCELTLIP
jgi:hypothetical protein